MPKAVHDLAEKLKGKRGVDNPWALATWMVKHGRTKRRGGRYKDVVESVRKHRARRGR